MPGKRRTKGKGTIYYAADRGKYMFQWTVTDPDGRRRLVTKTLAATTRKEAAAEAKTVEREVQAPDKAGLLLAVARIRRDAAPLPLAMVWRHFVKSKPTAGPGTLRNYERALSDFATWAEGRGIHQAGDVTEDTAAAYLEDLWQTGISANTHTYRRNALGLIWRTLARRFSLDDVWGRTPRQHSGYREGHKPLSADQTASLLRIVEERPGLEPRTEWRALVALQLFGGLRLKDAALLEWDAIDGAAGVIRYTPHKTRGKGKNAVVPLLPPVAAALAALPRSEGRILPALSELYERGGWRVDEPVVEMVQAAAGSAGRPNGDAPAQRVARRAAYAAHSLRTTFCTQAARAGATALQLAVMTGDSAATAAKFYVDAELIRAAPLPEFRRLLPDHAEAARDPERVQLHQLADALPLAAVRRVLKLLEG